MPHVNSHIKSGCKILNRLIVRFLGLSFAFSINLLTEMPTKANRQEPKVLEFVKFMCYTEI